jgi:hypothetical protein
MLPFPRDLYRFYHRPAAGHWRLRHGEGRELHPMPGRFVLIGLGIDLPVRTHPEFACRQHDQRDMRVFHHVGRPPRGLHTGLSLDRSLGLLPG